MLFTIKYGIPSAKYRAGIHIQGDIAFVSGFINICLSASKCSNTFYGSAGIIMLKYTSIIITLARHYGGPYLAQSDSMSPAVPFKEQSPVLPFHLKGGTFEMGLRQELSYNQLLPDYHPFRGSDNFKFGYTSGFSSLKRDKVLDYTEINAAAASYKV